MVITKPYLLTGGLVPLIENRHNLLLRPNTKRAIRDLEKAYSSFIASFLNGRIERDASGKDLYSWEVKFISDEIIDDALGKLIIHSRSGKPLISFDDVYCQNLVDGNYQVTRTQDPNKLDESPKLGPRFDSPDLETQVNFIRDKYGLNIDIMDIGAFGGSTLIPEIKRFRDAGINVGNVYLMFAGKEAIENLRNSNVCLNYVKTFDWIDWLEMRDCMGFDGRKVKMTPGKNNPDNSFVRYLERSNDWASIPLDVKAEYNSLYSSSFNAVKSILAEDRIEVDLRPSADNSLTYDLRIKRKSA